MAKISSSLIGGLRSSLRFRKVEERAKAALFRPRRAEEEYLDISTMSNAGLSSADVPSRFSNTSVALPQISATQMFREGSRARAA